MRRYPQGDLKLFLFMLSGVVFLALPKCKSVGERGRFKLAEAAAEVPEAFCSNQKITPCHSLAVDDRQDGFSFTEAFLFSRIARVLYEDEATIKEESQKLGFRATEVLDRGSFRFSMHDLFDEKSGVHLVVAFRGTVPTLFENLLRDVEFLSRGFYEGQVHEGFYKAYLAMTHDIFVRIEHKVSFYKEHKMPLHLWFTGHSLGGAISQVAFKDVIHSLRLDRESKSNFYPRGLYTIASPRVFDKENAKVTSSDKWIPKFYAIVMRSDPVPQLPKGLYVETGRKVPIEARDFHTNSVPDLIRCDLAKPKLTTTLSKLGLHSSRLYEDCLKVLAQKNPKTWLWQDLSPYLSKFQ